MPAGEDILYRCNVTWFLYGQNCINSFYFRSKPAAPSTTIPQEMQSIHDRIQTTIHAGWRTQMCNNVQLLSSVLTNLNGANFYEDVRNYPALYGNISATSMPSYCAAVVSWYTAFRGRRVHGRSYIPGVPQASLNGNDLNSGYLTGLQGQLSNILGVFGDGGSSPDAWMVVFSKKNGVTINPGPPPYSVYSPLAGIPITRAAIDLALGTQRHRKEGRGI